MVHLLAFTSKAIPLSLALSLLRKKKKKNVPVISNKLIWPVNTV